MALTEADLLREVARVQRRADLQEFRDKIESLDVTVYDRSRYSDRDRPAKEFRQDLRAWLASRVEDM